MLERTYKKFTCDAICARGCETWAEVPVFPQGWKWFKPNPGSPVLHACPACIDLLAAGGRWPKYLNVTLNDLKSAGQAN